MHSRIYCDSADRALLPSDMSKAFVVSAYGLTERSDYKTKIIKTKIINTKIIYFGSTWKYVYTLEYIVIILYYKW